MNSKSDYIESMFLIEKVYKSFLNAMKRELDELGIYEVNCIQALLLYQIGKNQINISDIISKGYYSGSNVSYNIKKMVQNQYVEQIQAKHDKRSIIIKLSNKGLNLMKKLDKVFEKHADLLNATGELQPLNETLGKLISLFSSPDLSRRVFAFSK